MQFLRFWILFALPRVADVMSIWTELTALYGELQQSYFGVSLALRGDDKLDNYPFCGEFTAQAQAIDGDVASPPPPSHPHHPSPHHVDAQ